jgi:hypothetical protein
METAPRRPPAHGHSPPAARAFKTRIGGFAILAATTAAFAGCGDAAPSEIETWEQEGLALNGLALNGLALNGLALNGLALNGLALNGLALNGLALNGLALNGFSDWFNNADGGDITMHAGTMKYVIGCALSPGRTASFTDRDGRTHTWYGNLALADGWDVNPLTADQQSWISGCVLAHANSALPTPKTIQISVRGAHPGLAVTSLEKNVITNFDGVYFGDLFSPENKRYVCSSGPLPVAGYKDTLLTDWGRQCYYGADGCGVFTKVDCAVACQQSTAEYAWGPTCTVDGRTYNAVNAYVPRFKRALEFTRSTGVQYDTACVGCIDGRALTSIKGKTYAEVGAWTGTASGNVWLDVRYNAVVATKMRVQVAGVNVMNGASPDWSFPSTGNSSTWRVVSIPATLASGNKVRLTGATTGVVGPKVDVVSIRVR